MNVLIIEHDQKVVREVVANLRKHGFATDVAFEGEHGLDLVGTDGFKLIIQSVDMPDIDGWQLAETIRHKTDIPLLLLSSIRSVEDSVRGLNLGADDFVNKPFEIEELLARITSLLKRGSKLEIRSDVIATKKVQMDLTAHRVLICGKEIDLKKKEYSLLEYFLRNKNKILTRMQILTHVWDKNVDTLTNTVDVHVASLRKKLKKCDSELITTIHGVGYMLKD